MWHVINSKHKQFLAFVTADYEPTQFSDAVFNPKWWEAMRLEIDALEKNGTWELTQLPIGKCVHGSKWV